MTISIETLPELLDLIIQGSLIILLIVFIFVGVRLLKILGVIGDLAESIAEMVETVNMVLWQPIKFFTAVMDKVRAFFGK